jgi:hypothetical protein
MKQLTTIIKSALAATSLLGAVSSLQGAEVEALFEGFETDGLNSRYFALGQGDNGELTFFNRREEFSAGADASGGTIGGSWFWGASDIDAINQDLPSDLYPDLGNRDGVLIFDDIDVSGLGNLRIEMSVAQGEGTFEPDNHFQIQVRFDDVDPSSPTYGSKEWITIGGFRAVSTNTPARYFIGPLRLTTDADPRLTSQFQDWSWELYGFGSTMDMRIIANSNYYEEDYYIDNIRIVGDDAAVQVAVTMDSYELTEPESTEQVAVTFTTATPAPAGGLVLNVSSDEWLDVTLPMPETVTIPEGQTTLVATLNHIADGRFTGTKVIEAQFSGEGVSREVLRFKVANTTPKPKVLVMEVLNNFPGNIEADVIGDANGDGARTYPGDLFVEVVNFESFPVDMSGWTVHDDLGPRFQYPEGTILQPGRSIVIFGGGEPTGVFGGATVGIVGTSNGFAFNTTRAEICGFFAPFGGEMEIIDLPFRSQMLEITGALAESDPAFGQPASIHRESDEVDSPFTYHSLISGASGGQSLFFSPGTRPNGDPYFTPSSTVTLALSNDTIAEGDSAVNATVNLSNPAPAGGLNLSVAATEEGSQVSLSTNTLTIPAGSTTGSFTINPIDDVNLDGPVSISVVVNGESGSDVLGGIAYLTVQDNEFNTFDFEISEFLIDLTGTGEDPNLDGTSEQAIADQFIEIVNTSGYPVVMSGWSLLVRVGSEFAIEQFAHTFDNGTILQNNGSAVIFGEIAGGKKSDASFNGAIVDDASNDDSNGGLHAAAGSSVFVDLVNEFGFTVATVSIPAELTAQGMSVAMVEGTPSLHLDAAGGAFNLYSPGATPDGTPYAGNGVWAPQAAFGDIIRTSPTASGTISESESLGNLYADAWPYIYSYGANSWWYYVVSTGNGGHWLYDFTNSTYVWVYQPYYPFVYAVSAGNWIAAE